MLYYSTNNAKNRVSLKKAVLKGLADDKGLFMPATLPSLPKNFIQNIRNYSFQDISFEVAKAFFADDIPYKDLQAIISDAINFETPLVQLDDETFVLELWHGPTLAFKDVGARFMARLLGHFSKKASQETNILVATSGDTGSAVANGFFNVPGIHVTILYPKGGVSTIQEQQLTTLGNNITAIEIEGTFDDCQRLVKSAFTDSDINARLTLTSANSINIARLIPQSFYYFYAYAQLKDKVRPVIFSVPCGNFGNLTAGLLTTRMGLPVHRFIASTNVNQVFPEYLDSGNYKPRPSIPTISNAMDVGDPSNFHRMLELYDHSVEKMRNEISSYSFDDDQTRETIKEIHSNFQYIIDPHGAVGYLGLNAYLEELKAKEKKKKTTFNSIILETAHPSKFFDTVKETLNIDMVIPERLEKCLKKEKNAVTLSKEFEDLKSYLMSKN
jgi:threonine synthase